MALLTDAACSPPCNAGHLNDRASSSASMCAGAWTESDEGALEVVTLVTSEGVYRLPSRVRVPAAAPGETQGENVARVRRPRREEEYMDPLQQLCLGAVFDIKAINVSTPPSQPRRCPSSLAPCGLGVPSGPCACHIPVCLQVGCARLGSEACWLYDKPALHCSTAVYPCPVAAVGRGSHPMLSVRFSHPWLPLLPIVCTGREQRALLPRRWVLQISPDAE